MKYAKFALFFIAFIFAMVALVSDEAQAAGYDVTLEGLNIYLSKAEATTLADRLERGGDGVTLAAVLSAWIPEPVLSKLTAGTLTLSGVYARGLARNLRGCSNNGARMTVPWPIGGWHRSLNITIVSR